MASQDKKLPPSQRKLDKARADGQVVRSRDLGHFAAVAAGGALLVALAPQISSWLSQMLTRALRFNVTHVQSPASMLERLFELTLASLWIVVPMGLIMMIVAILAGLAAGGWTWTFKPLTPNLNKLNPIAGMGRVFSKGQVIEALKASLLTLILGTIGALYLRAHIADFGGALGLPLGAALSHVGATILAGMLLQLLALGLFATVDVPMQKYLHRDRLRMSVQELKQEQRDVDGNVEIKAKVKLRMREMANRRMLAAVPKADLVVMNPTHYAVALKYDDAKMGAPLVLAKGADLMAMRIRDAAREAKVPVLQAPVLARALYAHAEVDREIPSALFGAVAQVLAYVYQLRAAIRGLVPMPGDLPELHVPVELDPHHLLEVAAKGAE